MKNVRIYADICIALLSAPVFSNHRRLHSVPTTGRPRAQSNVSLPTSRIQPFSPVATQSPGRLQQTTSSPLQTRRNHPSLNHSANLMSTPPPNRALARQLKLKGSLTDPAQSRRREAFGAVCLSLSLPMLFSKVHAFFPFLRFLSRHKISDIETKTEA